jgi:hypothetical protein
VTLNKTAKSFVLIEITTWYELLAKNLYLKNWNFIVAFDIEFH